MMSDRFKLEVQKMDTNAILRCKLIYRNQIVRFNIAKYGGKRSAEERIFRAVRKAIIGLDMLAESERLAEAWKNKEELYDEPPIEIPEPPVDDSTYYDQNATGEHDTEIVIMSGETKAEKRAEREMD